MSPERPVLHYVEPMRRFRFLISDGRIIDVDATRDDSTMRSWVLTQLGATKSDDLRIEGVASLPEQETLL